MELHVEGMTCDGCANSVSKALTNLDQNARVKTDLPSRIVRVETSASQASVLKALDDAGYSATPR